MKYAPKTDIKPFEQLEILTVLLKRDPLSEKEVSELSQNAQRHFETEEETEISIAASQFPKNIKVSTQRRSNSYEFKFYNTSKKPYPTKGIVIAVATDKRPNRVIGGELLEFDGAVQKVRLVFDGDQIHYKETDRVRLYFEPAPYPDLLGIVEG